MFVFCGIKRKAVANASLFFVLFGVKNNYAMENSSLNINKESNKETNKRNKNIFLKMDYCKIKKLKDMLYHKINELNEKIKPIKKKYKQCDEFEFNNFGFSFKNFIKKKFSKDPGGAYDSICQKTVGELLLSREHNYPGTAGKNLRMFNDSKKSMKEDNFKNLLYLFNKTIDDSKQYNYDFDYYCKLNNNNESLDIIDDTNIDIKYNKKNSSGNESLLSRKRVKESNDEEENEIFFQNKKNKKHVSENNIFSRIIKIYQEFLVVFLNKKSKSFSRELKFTNNRVITDVKKDYKAFWKYFNTTVKDTLINISEIFGLVTNKNNDLINFFCQNKDKYNVINSFFNMKNKDIYVNYFCNSLEDGFKDFEDTEIFKDIFEDVNYDETKSCIEIVKGFFECENENVNEGFSNFNNESILSENIIKSDKKKSDFPAIINKKVKENSNINNITSGAVNNLENIGNKSESKFPFGLRNENNIFNCFNNQNLSLNNFYKTFNNNTTFIGGNIIQSSNNIKQKDSILNFPFQIPSNANTCPAIPKFSLTIPFVNENEDNIFQIGERTLINYSDRSTYGKNISTNVMVRPFSTMIGNKPYFEVPIPVDGNCLLTTILYYLNPQQVFEHITFNGEYLNVESSHVDSIIVQTIVELRREIFDFINKKEVNTDNNETVRNILNSVLVNGGNLCEEVLKYIAEMFKIDIFLFVKNLDNNKVMSFYKYSSDGDYKKITESEFNDGKGCKIIKRYKLPSMFVRSELIHFELLV